MRDWENERADRPCMRNNKNEKFMIRIFMIGSTDSAQSVWLEISFEVPFAWFQILELDFYDQDIILEQIKLLVQCFISF